MRYSTFERGSRRPRMAVEVARVEHLDPQLDVCVVEESEVAVSEVSGTAVPAPLRPSKSVHSASIWKLSSLRQSSVAPGFPRRRPDHQCAAGLVLEAFRGGPRGAKELPFDRWRARCALAGYRRRPERGRDAPGRACPAPQQGCRIVRLESISWRGRRPSLPAVAAA